jgi:hypothetical protein
MGPPGSSKSTLLAVLAELQDYDPGAAVAKRGRGTTTT